MTYKLLDGRIVEDENDERLTKKFGNTYSYFKNQHPDLYKLPEEEVGEICRRYNQNPYGDTHEKAVARTNNYINNQMPRWQQQYFNKPRQTRTTCAWGTIEQPKAPKQTQPMMTTFSGKPLKQHSLADLDGTKEMYKQMSFKPAPAPKPAAQPKAPQMTPMPQMQTPTPWATGQTGMSGSLSYNNPLRITKNNTSRFRAYPNTSDYPQYLPNEFFPNGQINFEEVRKRVINENPSTVKKVAPSNVYTNFLHPFSYDIANYAANIGYLMDNYNKIAKERLHDKYKHAYLNCLLAQNGKYGENTADTFSTLKELYDVTFHKNTPEESAQDMAANLIGRYLGKNNPNQNCDDLLKPYISKKYPYQK